MSDLKITDMVGVKVTAEMAKGYFENMRRYMCEEHLKLCPKGTVAYYATIKEKEFYDMAIKALEENEQIKAQINRWFQKATDKMKAKNDHDEQLLDYAERLQDECKDLQRRNEDLSKCVELWTESNRKTREAIQKAREEIEASATEADFADYNNLSCGEEMSTETARCEAEDISMGVKLDDVRTIFDKYLGEAKDDKSDRNK